MSTYDDLMHQISSLTSHSGWQNDLIQRANAANFGDDGSGRTSGTGGAWSDPTTGLSVMRNDGGGYMIAGDSMDPSKGHSMAWDVGGDGALKSNDPRYFTTGSLSSMVGDTLKEGGIPLALAALGANAAAGNLGDFFGGAAGGTPISPSEASSFWELNAGNAAPVGAGAPGAAGLPEVSFAPWSATPDYAAQFVNAATPAAGDLALEPIIAQGLDASAIPSMTASTSALPTVLGSTTALTPAVIEAAVNTPGYGFNAAASAATGAASGLNAAGTIAAGGGFLDKLASGASDFFSNPANLLKTVATIGALTQDNSTDGTTTTTKSLDPRLASIVFGADGNSGVVGDLKSWAAANPTGQNQTMRDAQNGLRDLLNNPNLLDSFYRQGAAGNALIANGVAPNPWRK
jgi:hypothetical protein